MVRDFSCSSSQDKRSPKRKEFEGGPGKTSNGDLARNLLNSFQASQEMLNNTTARRRAATIVGGDSGGKLDRSTGLGGNPRLLPSIYTILLTCQHFSIRGSGASQVELASKQHGSGLGWKGTISDAFCGTTLILHPALGVFQNKSNPPMVGPPGMIHVTKNLGCASEHA